jgi:hypothetical protein
MMRRNVVMPVICLGVWMGAANAQFGRGVGDWITNGADAQRSSWIRTDAKISSESLQKPGFEFLWKLKLDANAKQSFAAPVLLNSYIGYRGFRSLAFVGVTSNKVVGIDTDLGKIEWQKQLPGDGASSACDGAMTSLTRPATAAFPAAGSGGGGLGGRSGPAKSAVGEPDEGSVILKQVAAQAAVQRGRPGGPGMPPGGFQRMPSLVHTLTSDGMLNSLFVSNGEPAQPPVRFLPGNAIALGLIVIDNVAYAAASPGCGVAPDAVIAVHLTSKGVANWKPDSGSIAGSAGPAIGPDGTLYISTTGGELAALEPKTLKLKAAYKAGQPFTSSPIIFEFKDKVLIAVATKDGRVHLLDSKDLNKPAAISDAANLNAGALASWQDSSGARWILGTSGNAVVALKVADQNGAPALQPGWSSRDIASPLAPMVVNGVVFTASTGVLYALDATSGKELWNSGSAITGAIRRGGLSAGNSQVYLATSDGTFYAFGFPIEH